MALSKISETLSNEHIIEVDIELLDDYMDRARAARYIEGRIEK